MIFHLDYMSQVIDSRIDSNSRVYFVKGDRTAIVDTGAPGNEHKILKALKRAWIPRGKVSVLIVTHAHWDHCGSLRALKAALGGVPVIAGWPDAEYLEKGENVPVTYMEGMATAKNASRLIFEGVKADIVAKRDLYLIDYGIDARVLTTPGHTGGSLSVLARNGDCATGDFLAGLYAGERGVIEESLKKMTTGGAKRFYPSHGTPLGAELLLKTFFLP